MYNKIIKTIIGPLFAILTFPSYAIPFTNGDFSAGLTGWNDASSTGTIAEVGGVAQLNTGAGNDPFSAVLVQGDDGFFNFNPPITLGATDLYLNFDANFLDLGVDSTESGGSFFSDYLSVVLYDAIDITGASDLFFQPGIDSDLTDWNRFHLDISSLAGNDIALSFELSDQDDGRDSRVFLDNITFTSLPDFTITVPEPSSIALVGLGLLLGGLTKRKMNK